MTREQAIEAGHVWTDFKGCEEHVCVLPLDHKGVCLCECHHDSDGRYVKSPIERYKMMHPENIVWDTERGWHNR